MKDCDNCKHKAHYVNCPYLADYRLNCCYYTPRNSKKNGITNDYKEE